jgi:two-component sensor histidine kinase
MTTKQAASEQEIAAKLRRYLRILVDLGKIAGQNLPLQSFLDQAVVQVARATEIHHVKVLRYRPKAADLLLVAGIGWKEGVVGSATFPVKLRFSPGRTFLTAEPTLVPDIRKSRDYVFSNILSEHGIISLANVPVLIDGAAWGVLEVDSTEPSVPSEDMVQFLVAASTLMGFMARRAAVEKDGADALAAVVIRAPERDVLLREMQHRIKNNFQLILSSISLQKRRFEAADVQRALDHVASRINAVSLAHDQLSPTQAAHVVDMAGYLRALSASVEQQTEGVAVEVELDQVEIGIDRAVPLGLIVNEAMTNSVKHAFGEGGGRITIRLTTGVGIGEARLVVADNGRGIKAPDRPGGSGIKLINSLARQVGGQMELESSVRGTTTTVTFPVIS